MAILNPNYLNLDFTTIKDDIITSLRATDTFKDYNFEGANITVLIEMLAYLGDINTFYMNRISKEMYLDTVELYENAHRLSQLSGYVPIGYTSSTTDLKITLTQAIPGTYFSLGDELSILKFKTLTAAIENSDNITFLVNNNVLETVTLDFVDSGLEDDLTTFEMDVPIKEGTSETLNYVGSVINNYKIYLPFYNYDHTVVDVDTETSVGLTVNDILGQRVNTFFEDISGIENEYNLYRFVFDKYKKYYIEFSSSLSVPIISDNIQIELIKTLGAEGNVGANLITEFDDTAEFIYNVTKGIGIPEANITITNPRASNGGSSYEDIDSLKQNALAFAHSQFRCTTKNDYKNYLEKRTEIVKGTAGGQQELTYASDTRDYNKIYLTFIPLTGDVSTISNTTDTGTLNNGNSTTIIVPTSYLTSFRNELETYFEPYKMMNTYHSYVLPELVYISLDATIEVYSNYIYSNVLTDIKSKLDYLFDTTSMDFGETIDFREIERNILDTTIESTDNSFVYIKGIRYFNIREMHVNKTIYEPNNEQNYPQYKTVSHSSYIDNTLRSFILGPGQFPIFVSSAGKYTNEG